MTLKGAIELAFAPGGRINRATYFFSLNVLLVICGLATNAIAHLLGLNPAYGFGGKITLYGTAVLMLWPSIALTVKRTHDLGFSGWFALLGFVPYVGWVPTLMLMFGKGPEKPVRYWPFKALHA